MAANDNERQDASALKRTPLFDLHVSLGAKMVPFAGYEMPVQYPMGVLKEHLWTRESCGLFDVSHMGQAFIVADDAKHETAGRAFESQVAADVVGLAPGQQRYSQLLDGEGGIVDDLMVTRLGLEGHTHWLYVVVNASRKDVDYALIASRLTKGVELKPVADWSLLALQGPAASDVLSAHDPRLHSLKFMTSVDTPIAGMRTHISRTGYTGEDGFEIAVEASNVVALAKLLLADPRVKPIGLGARDSLRLEAGLCLYGHDIDETTSPIEAGLAWSIQKRRRIEGGFPGAARVQRELRDGPPRVRVGIRPDGRAPARDGTEIVSEGGEKIGHVTSGGFGPTVNAPIAMGYVAAAHAKPGTKLQLMVRGKPLPATVVALPFVPHRYVRS